MHGVQLVCSGDLANCSQDSGLWFVVFGGNWRSNALCYDPASSLRKRNDVQGKGWLNFSSLGLTNGVARADAEDNISGTGTGGSKGESVTTTAEAGAEDTSSDGY